VPLLFNRAVTGVGHRQSGFANFDILDIALNHLEARRAPGARCGKAPRHERPRGQANAVIEVRSPYDRRCRGHGWPKATVVEVRKGRIALAARPTDRASPATSAHRSCSAAAAPVARRAQPCRPFRPSSRAESGPCRREGFDVRGWGRVLRTCSPSAPWRRLKDDGQSFRPCDPSRPHGKETGRVFNGAAKPLLGRDLGQSRPSTTR